MNVCSICQEPPQNWCPKRLATGNQCFRQARLIAVAQEAYWGARTRAEERAAIQLLIALEVDVT
jgi:hypothetical protein